VNLFDTFHASKVLEKERHSFAHLLEHYCGVTTDKKYQLADWRIRPLTPEMLRYAQCDTHYLLYIYDLMRNELLGRESMGENSPIEEVLGRSALTSLKRYEKYIYDIETGEGSGGWKNVIKKCNIPLNDMNIAVFRALHSWRDHIARKEDESTRFVIPNHMLLNLSRFMPVTAKDVIIGCSPTPALVRLYAKELATIIEQAMAGARSIKGVSDTIFHSPSLSVNVQQAPSSRKSSEPLKNRVTTTFVTQSSLFGNSLVKKPLSSDQVKIIESSFCFSKSIEMEPKIATSIFVPPAVSKPEVIEIEPKVSNSKNLKRKDATDLLAELKVPKKKVRQLDAHEFESDFKAFDYSQAFEVPLPKISATQFNPMKHLLEEDKKVSWVH
jgi:ribonuclease D